MGGKGMSEICPKNKCIYWRHNECSLQVAEDTYGHHNSYPEIGYKCILDKRLINKKVIKQIEPQFKSGDTVYMYDPPPKHIMDDFIIKRMVTTSMYYGWMNGWPTYRLCSTTYLKQLPGRYYLSEVKHGECFATIEECEKYVKNLDEEKE